MSQIREYNVLHHHAAPPLAWHSGNLKGEQYIKVLEIKYSRLETGVERTSIAEIITEAIDQMYEKEKKEGKVIVRRK